MSVTIERIRWQGWQDCYLISNERVEMLVVADVGPRILKFNLVGQDSLLKLYDEQLGQTQGDTFRIYGGHRLWHAPENQKRTYYPDNRPVEVARHDNIIQFNALVEDSTRIQKSIQIEMHPTEPRATVRHSLTNHNLWAVTFAPWALTVMRSGGVAILPLPERGSHPEDLLPSSSLALWPYTNLADPRWTWGTRYILLRQADAPPQKIGAYNPAGWLAYAWEDTLFVKQFDVTSGDFPDFGSNVEMFTDSDMLEIESLGPLQTVQPGTTVTHTEIWSLHADVPQIQNEQDVTLHVMPCIQA